MPNQIANQTQIKDYIRQGNQLKKAGNLTEAQEKYTAALELNPKSVPALNQLGKIYEQQQDYHQAIPYLQKIVQYKPDNIEFQQRLAEALMKTKDFSAAATAYQAALMLQPKDPKTLYNSLAEALAKQGEALQAITIYQNLLNSEAVEILKQNSRLGDVIIQLSVRQGTLQQAMTCFRKACEHQPLNSWHHYYLATALVKQNDIDEAVNAYQKTIEIQPDLFQAYLGLSKVLMQKKQREQAFKVAIKALKLKPKHHKIHLFIRDWARIFSKQVPEQEFKEKGQAYFKTLKKIDEPGMPYAIIADVLFELEQLSEAIQYNQSSLYQNLKKVKPEFISKHWVQGGSQKPSFLIIGVAKCGTSSLYDYMIQHPQILPAVMKEPSKLSHKWKKIDHYLDYYSSLFPLLPQSERFQTGEASTSYFVSEQAAQIISSYFSDSKLIIILRNPVKRYISQYQFNLKKGIGKQSLQKTIDSDLKKIESMKDSSELLSVLERTRFLKLGMYVYFIKRWMSLLPREQFLILRMEDLAENPNSVMKQVFNFLDVPNYQDIQYLRKNQGTYSAQIDENLLSRLYDFYRPHNQKLEEFLGRKFNWEP